MKNNYIELFSGDVSRRSVGTKEGSGFTHAYNVEPITFHPDNAHLADVPVRYYHFPFVIVRFYNIHN